MKRPALPLPRPPAVAAAALVAPSAAVGVYRVALLAAAVLPARVPTAPGPPVTRFATVIPAHDEAGGIVPTITAALAQDYPPGLHRVVVVADNCSDATAAVARSGGAEVLERTDPRRRGKGHALAWALPQVLDSADAVVLIDADCLPAADLLRRFDARLRAGARVVQADYRVANPAASEQSALRYAGFVLENTVRSAGRSRLGASSGLLGTGMAFTRDVLERHPWEAFSFAEDREYHLRLVAAGERVVFAGETEVRSDMPVTAAAAHSQEQRWESGRAGQLRRDTPRLLRAAVRRRELAPADAAIEPLLPPQAMWAAMNGAGLVVAAASGSRHVLVLALAAAAGQGVFVTCGLAAAGTPRAVWRALATGGPAFVARRVARIAAQVTGPAPTTWVRTEREAAR